jgi:hypothetical protein
MDPVVQDLFWVKHPLLQAIFEQKAIEQHKLEGYKKTFVVYNQGPGNVTQIITGNETINGGRKNIGAKGEEESTRMIYAYDIPLSELDQVDGKMDIAKLFQKYPVAAMDDFMLRINRQLCVGDGTDVGGFLTLNGNTTYAPQGTAKTGVFEYAAPASQNDTVFNLQKQGGASGVDGWYNQYGNITSFSSDGLRTLRDVYFKASQQGRAKGNVSLGFCDLGTYSNYLATLEQFVRTPAGLQDDVVGKSFTEYVMFHNCKLYVDLDIDITDALFAATPAANGLAYLLHPASWKLFHYNAGKDQDGSGKPNLFRRRAPFRIPTKDMTRFESILDANIYCDNLRMNGVVTGGAV